MLKLAIKTPEQRQDQVILCREFNTDVILGVFLTFPMQIFFKHPSVVPDQCSTKYMLT